MIQYTSFDYSEPPTATARRDAQFGCGIEASVGVDPNNSRSDSDTAVVSFTAGGQGGSLNFRIRSEHGDDVVDIIPRGGNIEIPELADAMEWAAQELRRQHAEACNPT
ncbi:hypothetical protein [Tsukamurella strandjordii]|uniref:Uncharacterized protein n=1 Tax=Tsukamurella strandjordii TaxID=147577 RepID=A0AA90SRQ3_9ACTN|nr:hypothetical protein [Tsukamurella strandjordii]MDP0399186.1 hypothetical protein [Tsukamurella strandjordii]